MHHLIGNITIVVLICTVLAGLIVSYQTKKNKKKTQENNEAFWARETKANNVRRKDISGLPYIKIPFDSLPFIDTEDYDIDTCQKELRALEGKKILNLSGFSNTDLKLEYGVANLTQLSEYDENCTRMFRTLANLGYHLSRAGHHREAVAFLEFGIECGTDISRNFFVLADEYISAGEYRKAETLLEKAGKITTPMGPSIVKELTAKLKSPAEA